jgi:GNAT superfamily N-acetyltransferase
VGRLDVTGVEVGPVASPSESERFGLAVGRMTVVASGDATTDAANGEITRRVANEAVLAERFDLVVVRLPFDPAWRSEDGLELIDGGCAVTFEGSSHAVEPRARSERLRRIEQWSSEHTTVVTEIFAGYRNHVAANPRLDASVIPVGYADWSARHVDGRVPGDCFLMEDGDGRTLAFAAVAPDGDALVIDLAGVMPAHRGRGVYQLLLDRLEEVAAARGHDRVLISTQVGNRLAVRAWLRRGWAEVAREWTVHVMRTGRDGRI